MRNKKESQTRSDIKKAKTILSKIYKLVGKNNSANHELQKASDAIYKYIEILSL